MNESNAPQNPAAPKRRGFDSLRLAVVAGTGLVVAGFALFMYGMNRNSAGVKLGDVAHGASPGSSLAVPALDDSILMAQYGMWLAMAGLGLLMAGMLMGYLRRRRA
jgi:uncharacterized membrane protein